MGGQTLGISGDIIIQVDVATNMGIKTAIQEFLILKHDSEAIGHGSPIAFIVSREKL